MRRHSFIATVATLGLLLAACRASATPRVVLEVRPAQPVLAAGSPHTTYLKIGLRGLPVEVGRRAPVNLAVVLDRSGSMQGEKLEQAKAAAIAAIDRLGAEDIVSVVAYDDTVQVLLPATRATDQGAIRRAISRLEAGDTTALFAGVCQGASELRKFLHRGRVNRLILLSDGLANVGPDRPGELAELGASLKKEGITVTTVGLGLDYNEDLMSRLAAASDGSHAFVENARDLARIFDFELGDVLSAVAQQVVVRIECGPGIRPLRVLGREAEIVGRTVTLVLSQVYAEQEKYVLLEVETPPGRLGESRDVASVEISFADLAAGADDRLAAHAGVRFASAEEAARAGSDPDVMVAVVEQVAAEQNLKALALRDEGRIDAAQRLLLDNASYIATNAQELGSAELEALARANRADADNLAPDQWEKQRKQMLDQQNKLQQQRKW